MAAQDTAMDTDDIDERLKDKVQILPGHAANLSACTFVLHEEDHTLGNALRYMIMKNPSVEFCGYSAPHPSEAKIHLRIQMYDQLSALDALSTALDNLEALFLTIQRSYSAALQSDTISRPEKEEIDWEDVKSRAEANRRAGAVPGEGGELPTAEAVPNA